MDILKKSFRVRYYSTRSSLFKTNKFYHMQIDYDEACFFGRRIFHQIINSVEFSMNTLEIDLFDSEALASLKLIGYLQRVQFCYTDKLGSLALNYFNLGGAKPVKMHITTPIFPAIASNNPCQPNNLTFLRERQHSSG